MDPTIQVAGSYVKHADPPQIRIPGTKQALVPTKNQELGRSIVSEAQKKYDEQRREKVLTTVTTLMANRDSAVERISHFTKQQDWYERKIKALQDGTFDFDGYGNLTFTDPDLQRANY